MTMPRYETFDVRYEHTDADGANRTVNRAIVTCYGGGELLLRREIERERPSHHNVTVLEVTRLR